MAEVVAPSPAPISNIRTKAIIRDQLQPSSRTSQPLFDANKHLNFVEPSRILTLKHIGLPEDAGISPVAVSDPFALFTEEAIRIMRGEILSHEVWDNCLFSTDFAGCQLKGRCLKYAPFTYDAWKDPKTLEIVSKIAGIDVVPVIGYEIANINVSVKDPENDRKKLESQPDDDLPVTKWHFDSYPIVCVVMMSDASNMLGGETALRTGSGDILKVRWPQMGCAIVLQGRCISPQALGAIWETERITMVTAFKPRDPFIPDTSVLTTIRPISGPSELYFQWTKYRIDVLQERLRGMRRLLEEQHRAGKRTGVRRIKEFLKQQEEWLGITHRQMDP